MQVQISCRKPFNKSEITCCTDGPWIPVATLRYRSYYGYLHDSSDKSAKFEPGVICIHDASPVLT